MKGVRRLLSMRMDYYEEGKKLLPLGRSGFNGALTFGRVNSVLGTLAGIQGTGTGTGSRETAICLYTYTH